MPQRHPEEDDGLDSEDDDIAADEKVDFGGGGGRCTDIAIGCCVGYGKMTESTMLDTYTPTTDPARAAQEALGAPDATVTIHVGDRSVTVPEDAVEHLRAVLDRLAEGHRVRVVDDDPELTTQEAADLLNLSRPHFVRLLESGKLPFHAVGTHRRVLLADVLAYKAARSAKREAAFRILADEAQKHDLGY